MYKSLAKNISSIFQSFSKKQLNANDIDKAMEAIEHALIDADVALEAVEIFKTHVKQRSTNTNKIADLSPQAQIMHIVKEALLELLNCDNREPLSSIQPGKVHIILMAGLQGAGKTTSCAKIAHYLQQKYKHKKIMMASTDIYRPAAIEQLKTLSAQVGCTFHPHFENLSPREISQQALDHAKKSHHDILIIDTAGRLEVDQERMLEIQQIHKDIRPHETIYVVDSMVGQSALSTARAFDEAIELTGVILSKVDSDTKGGVALSIRSTINKPIYWLGTGEKIDQLEPFDAERIANQILDMGDIVGLAQQAKKHIDENKAKEMTQRLKKGQFSFIDLLEQIQQISQLGGMKSILQMLPGAARIPDNILSMAEDESKLVSIKAIIQSMTRQEQMRPDLVRNNKKRQNRILSGSGRTNSELKQLLSTFDKIKKMTEKFKGGKMKAMMEKFKQMSDGDTNPPW